MTWAGSGAGEEGRLETEVRVGRGGRIDNEEERSEQEEEGVGNQ